MHLVLGAPAWLQEWVGVLLAELMGKDVEDPWTEGRGKAVLCREMDLGLSLHSIDGRL